MKQAHKILLGLLLGCIWYVQASDQAGAVAEGGEVDWDASFEAAVAEAFVTGKSIPVCVVVDAEAGLTEQQIAAVNTATQAVIKECERTCKECGYKATRVRDLERHMRRHTGEKPFVCETAGCGKAFTRPCHLKRHELTHTGEKPFVCKVEGCCKAFNQSSHLRKHEQTHTDEKLFACSLCDKQYGRKDSLEVHMLKHTGEGFPCDYCKLMCSRNDAKTRHEKICKQRPYVADQ